MAEVVVEGLEVRHAQRIRAGGNVVVADEPKSNGGGDTGPSPHELLLASLGACKSITIRMYADLKKIPLSGVSVKMRMEKPEPGKATRIESEITLEGNLAPEHRKRLIEIADRCPVHRTLTGEIEIVSREASK